MRTLEYVKHFKELEVYKRQRKFAREEQYSLTDQLRRSSRSIGAQIAEAWAKRLYPKHFVSKLTDADGEQMETQHWLIEAGDCNYLTETDSKQLRGICEEIGRMLGSMIQKPNPSRRTTTRSRRTSAVFGARGTRTGPMNTDY